MSDSPARAEPLTTELTEPFWRNAEEGQLVIQRCAACGYYNHPPREQCDTCLSGDLAWQPVSGRGAIWSFTVMHQKSVAGFETCTPYVTALVELEEQPMLLLMTNLPGTHPDDIRIGLPVHVTFEPLGDGQTLPQFVVDGGGLA